MKQLERDSKEQLQKLRRSQKTVSDDCFNQCEHLKDALIEVIEDCDKEQRTKLEGLRERHKQLEVSRSEDMRRMAKVSRDYF